MNHGLKAGRRLAAGVLSAALCVGAAGCRHKQAQPIVLPQQTPVALQPAVVPDQSVLLEAPKPPLPPVPVAEAASKPKPKKKRVKPIVPAAPAVIEPPPQVATAEETPEATAIGALTPGGEKDPKTQQEASDLIEANDKRLRALPEEKAKSQRSLISKVRNFQRQAQQAMRSGDLEGAKTLATKAKLLLDDIEKDSAGD